MQRVEASAEPGDRPEFAHDVSKLVRTVAAWADDRPVLASATLYGERLFARRNRDAQLRVAVRYDEAGMIDGFDDWIEQLRTDFASLRAQLSEPVIVLTPDCGAAWHSAIRAPHLAPFSIGKVRLAVSL